MKFWLFWMEMHYKRKINIGHFTYQDPIALIAEFGQPGLMEIESVSESEWLLLSN